MRLLLACGPALAILFVLVTLLLPPLIPGYSLVRQSVSEIGAVGSPLRGWFSLFVGIEAILAVAFAAGLRAHEREARRSTWPAWLAGSLALAYAGMAAFPTPLPMHNVFGLVSVVAYTALLAAALSWRRDPAMQGLARLSLALFLVFLLGFIGSLAATVVAAQDPVRGYAVLHAQGLMQRTYIYAFHLWALAVGVTLLARRRAQARNFQSA